MKTKFLSLLVVYFIITSVFSQSNLNNYKYVIVPKKYDFLKEKDQYQLNSLTQFLFNKFGFEAIIEGEKYPEDLIKNRCLALKSDVLKDSGMFKTKLNVEFKDCNDQVVYTSETGESREKEYARAYNDALREAFKSIEALNYKYEPNTNITGTANTQEWNAQNDVSNEIQRLKQEIENIKRAKEVEYIDPVISNEMGKEVLNDNKPLAEETFEERQAKRQKKEQEIRETIERMGLKNDTIIKIKHRVEDFVDKPVKKEKAIKEGVKEVLSSVLYAQEIEHGFQLVDSSPKVVYRIKNTSMNNVFLVEGKNATLYKKENNWIMEYYENNVLKQEVLNIKF